MNIKLKKMYGIFLSAISFLFGIGFAKRFDSKLRFHRKLNLKNPQSLAEKILWIEFYHMPKLYEICADKLAVRKYVKNKGYGHILVPILGNEDGYTDPNKIPFSDFPRSYVIKATHGSKMNYFVKDSASLDTKDCKKQMKEWLSTTYGKYSLEPHYFNMPHRIYIEEFLPDAENIIDYKFNCINGKPEFVFVVNDRKITPEGRMSMKMNTFDMNWNFIDEMVPSGLEIPGDGNVPRPEHFEEMKHIAEVLSQDFDFVRVDLFDLGGKVFFGELTFTPATGVLPFYTEKFLFEMGKKMKFDKCLTQ